MDIYKLSCSLNGHSMDVRGVATGVSENGKFFVVSGSRDRSAKIWMPADEEDQTTMEVVQTCKGHTNFVSCVCVIPPNGKYPSGLILSGGHDHTILGFELGKLAPIFRLAGHGGTVCSIAATSDSLLISGSWDTTAKVWQDQNNVATLKGHQAAVWAVAALPGVEHKILTASADKEIRLWVNYQSNKIYRGHTDCVRALVVVNENQFLSASNDAQIRLWNVESGETVNTFYGHTNFIYSLSLLPGAADFASVGEDRTLRIWRNGDCRQVIHLPATSIWSVATMKNGDIITGSSDGVVRIFSNDPSRVGPPDLIKDFEEQVSKSTIAAQQELGGLKITELPGPESLFMDGKKDGETKMVREGDKVGCYSWSAADGKWTKVGDVVGASGATQNTSGKVLYEGKEYDYVFSIELDDTKTTLKLPYNITEDPWFAAQKFIDKNQLSQLFLDQVANFITTNTKGMQLGTSNDPDYQDPFTGGGRYIPGSSNGSSANGSTGGGIDPFTGAGAYTTSSASAANNVKSDESLKFTSENYFPAKDYMQFTAKPNFDGIKKKLNDFINELGPDAVSTIPDNIDELIKIGEDPTFNIKVESLLTEGFSWPKEKVFPFLDLIRLGVLNSTFAVKLDRKMTIVEKFSKEFISSDYPNNHMLTTRILCNVFGPLNEQLMSHRSQVISQVLNNLHKGKQNQIATASLFFNFSIIVSNLDGNNNTQWVNEETKTEVLMALYQYLEYVEENEAVFRCLLAIGNLIQTNESTKNLFKSLGGQSQVDRYRTSGVSTKITDCATQILGFL